MKKMLSLLLCVFLLLQTCLVSFAVSETNGAMYTYQLGEQTISYYLDEHQMPYVLQSGQKVYIALSLPHLKVSDPTVLEQLNQAIHPRTRAIPTNYYDISYGAANVNSPAYSVNVSLPTATSTYTTSVLKMNVNHEAIRIKTTNHTPTLSRKINLTFYYYDQANDRWYYQSHRSVNCSLPNGYGILNNCAIYPYSQFFITKDSSLTSFTLTINTTYKA